MAWVKVPVEHRPIFHAALPNDPRVETKQMFGGIVAKVNGHVFAGLFGRSTMIWLPEPERTEALALPGAARFDPMGDGRATSNKVMLPERMMTKPPELRRWIARAFTAAARFPAKVTLPEKARRVRPDPPPRTASGKRSRAKRMSGSAGSGKRPGKRAAK